VKFPELKQGARIGLLAAAAVLAGGAFWIRDSAQTDLNRQTLDGLQRTQAAGWEAKAQATAAPFLNTACAAADAGRAQAVEFVRRAAGRGGPLGAWAAGVAPASRDRRVKSPATPQAALEASLQTAPSALLSAEWTDRSGKVIAAWPAGSPLGGDLSKDPYFKDLSDPSVAPGIPRHGYAKSVPALPLGKTQAAAPKTTAQLLVSCGLADKDGAFAGVIKFHLDARQTLLAGNAKAFEAFTAANPGAKAFLVTGEGQELWHSQKDPFTENLDAVAPEYRALLSASVQKPTGLQEVSSYDGSAGAVLWKRVGTPVEGEPAEDVLNLMVFLPHPAAAPLAGAGVPPLGRSPFLLFVLLLALALAALAVLSGVSSAGWESAASAVQGVGEFTPVPALVLPPAKDPRIQAVYSALTLLAQRATRAEGRVKELETAHRRLEDDAARQATLAAQDLSALREKLSAALAGSQSLEQKADATQKMRQDFETQVAHLRAALDTSTRNTEQRGAEVHALEKKVEELSRALEEQRRAASQAAGRGENEVVRLAAVNTLSAELKATLTVIKNYINTMLGSQGTISDAQQEFLGVVINKSARLERLIGDLVEISEIGSGVKPPRFEVVAPQIMAEDALMNARPQAEPKKINLEFLSGQAVGDVRVDREKIGGVLRSLLSQAIKVTSRGERITIQAVENGESVELRIADPGMSLPPDRAAKVFVEFHGVDSHAGPEFIGTGLRFPILKTIVEAQGGRIWIESQAGRGKTFVLALPKAESQAAAPSTVVSASAPPSPALPPPVAAPKLAPPAIPQGVSGGPKELPGLAELVAQGAPKSTASRTVHKPAPVDATLNAPWKRKESGPADDLGELMDLPDLAAPKPVAPKIPPVPTAGIDEFDKVFGSNPAPKAPASAAPDTAEADPFAKVFGTLGSSPQSAPSVPVTAPEASDIDKIFGSSLDADFDKIFGAPPASASAKPAAPAPTALDALFAPPPAPPQGGSKGPLQSMDDLNKLLGQ
jgi:signal transduction histidine kinase